jgi:hypothetical protein
MFLSSQRGRDYELTLQAAAKTKLTSKAWAYMSSGATDQYCTSTAPLGLIPLNSVALDINRRSWNRVLFRPRILIDVDEVDTSTKMLGQKTDLPVGFNLFFETRADKLVLHLSGWNGGSRPSDC